MKEDEFILKLFREAFEERLAGFFEEFSNFSTPDYDAGEMLIDCSKIAQPDFSTRISPR